MYNDDFNNDENKSPEINDNLNPDSENTGDDNLDGQYHFNYAQLKEQREQEQAEQEEKYSYETTEEKWQPDTEKFNTQQTPPKAKKAKWWIPLVAVLGAVVAAAVVVVIVGINSVKNYVTGGSASNEIATVAVADSGDSTVGTVTSSSNSTGTFVLTDVSDVVEAAMPSVVSITSRTYVSNYGYSNFWDFYNNRNSGGSSSGEEVDSGLGSGTIIGQNDTELLILTSYHVVDGCSSLYVTFNDEQNVDGYIKGADEDLDIAVVAVKLSDIPDSTKDSIKIATLCTDGVDVGDGIIVIGNALGYGQSVVTGIISAENRPFTYENKTMYLLQTDAAINNGNSGGCMLNSKGEIVGISEAKISSTAVEGVCYAIPIKENYDTIMNLMNAETETTAETNQSSNNNSTSSGNTAYIGIYGADIDSSTASSYNLQEGVYVSSLVSGGGAEKAGIQEGDIIIGIDGTTITTMSELQSELAKHTAGDKVTLTILRYQTSGYAKQDITVTTTGSLS